MSPPSAHSADADRATLRALVDGDRVAWRAFVRAHVGLLHAAVVRVIERSADGDGFDADDVVQAVFVKLWEDGRRRLASFRGRSRLSTWLVAVAQREAFDRVRARRPNGSVPDSSPAGEPGPTAPDAAAAAIQRESGEALGSALERLPARDRLLVSLVHVDGRSYADVARLLAVPENSISPWLGRARRRLARLLRPERTDSRPASL